MEVKQDYQEPIEQKPKRTFFGLIISVFSFLTIPFKFAKTRIDLIKEDNAKIRKFKIWHKRENGRYRRGIKLNDEF